MLRKSKLEVVGDTIQTENGTETGELIHPPPTQHPYEVEETRAVGVRFYRPRESFYFNYAVLTSMQWSDEKLVLRFASEEVWIEGRGLHEIYTLLALQRVGVIIEQGERYAGFGECSVYVSKLERIPV